MEPQQVELSPAQLELFEFIYSTLQDVQRLTSIVAVGVGILCGMYLWRLILLSKNEPRFWGVLLAGCVLLTPSTSEAALGDVVQYNGSTATGLGVYTNEIIVEVKIKYCGDDYTLRFHAKCCPQTINTITVLPNDRGGLVTPGLFIVMANKGLINDTGITKWLRCYSGGYCLGGDPYSQFPIHPANHYPTGFPNSSFADLPNCGWGTCLDYNYVPDPCPCDPNDPAADCDGDGIPNGSDPCPADPNPNCGNNPPCDVNDPQADCDGDGTPNGQDPCPTNPDPACVPCSIENPDLDCDGDGIPNGQDPCPEDPLNECLLIYDCDGDGEPDSQTPCTSCPAGQTCQQNTEGENQCPGDCDCDGVPDETDPCPCDSRDLCDCNEDYDGDCLRNCEDSEPLTPNEGHCPPEYECPCELNWETRTSVIGSALAQSGINLAGLITDGTVFVHDVYMNLEGEEIFRVTLRSDLHVGDPTIDNYVDYARNVIYNAFKLLFAWVFVTTIYRTLRQY